MKQFLFVLFLGTTLFSGVASATTEAQFTTQTKVEVGKRRRARSRVRHRLYYGGFWPGYVIVRPWRPVGYSYWGYYNYLPRYAGFGAIAYDAGTNTVGLDWGYATRFSAERAAVRRCGTKDCRSVVWVQGGCAAIAMGQKVAGVAWGYGREKKHATYAAKKACKKAKAKRCKVRAFVCSY